MFRVLLVAVVWLQVAVHQSYGSIFCDTGRPVVDSAGDNILGGGFPPPGITLPQCPPPTIGNFLSLLPDKPFACCLPTTIPDPCLNNTSCNKCTQICVPQCESNSSCSNPEPYCKDITTIVFDSFVCPPPSQIPTTNECVFNPDSATDPHCEFFFNCSNGESCCEETCNKVCKTKEDPCNLIDCQDGYICYEGDCIQDRCPNYQAPARDVDGRVIICDGLCRECPYGYECEVEPPNRFSICCPAEDVCDDGPPAVNSQGDPIQCYNDRDCPKDYECNEKAYRCCRAEDVCDDGPPAVNSQGMPLKCYEDDDCPDNYECNEDAYVCCKDEDRKDIGLIVALVVVSIMLVLFFIVCICCCCCQGDQGPPGGGISSFQGSCCQGGSGQGGDCCGTFIVCCCGMMCGCCGSCDERPRYQPHPMGSDQPTHHPSAPNLGYVNQGGQQQTNLAYSNQGLNQIQQNNVGFTTNQGFSQAQRANISFTNNAGQLYPGLNNQPNNQLTQYYTGNQIKLQQNPY